MRIPSQNQGDPREWLVHAAGYAAWGLIAKPYPLCTCVSWRPPFTPFIPRCPLPRFRSFQVVIDPPRDTVFHLVQLPTAESRCSSPFLFTNCRSFYRLRHSNCLETGLRTALVLFAPSDYLVSFSFSTTANIEVLATSHTYNDMQH